MRKTWAILIALVMASTVTVLFSLIVSERKQRIEAEQRLALSGAGIMRSLAYLENDNVREAVHSDLESLQEIVDYSHQQNPVSLDLEMFMEDAGKFLEERQSDNFPGK